MEVLNLKFKGSSMEGLLKDGDSVNIQLYPTPKEISSHHLGKIVLFKDNHEWVTHRVVSLNNTLFTKGDQSLNYDSPKEIWGEVFSAQTKNGIILWPFKKSAYNSLIALISKFYHLKTPRAIRWPLRKAMQFTGFISRSVFLGNKTTEIYLSLLRNEKPFVLSENVNDISTLAREHFLSAYLNNKINIKNKDQFPKWKTDKKLNAINSVIVLNQLKEIREYLPKKITPCLLKGASLLKRAYPDIGTRFMSDIDFLVSENQLKDVEKILSENGFKKMTEDHGSANSCKSMWLKPSFDSEIVIDIHTKLNWFQPDNFEWNFIPSQIKGYWQLNPVDEMIYLAIHLSYSHNFQRLFWLIDIYELLKLNGSSLDWQGFSKRAKQVNGEKAVASVLYAIENLFNFKLEIWPLSKKYTYLKVLMTKKFLINPYGSMIYFLIMKHLLQDSLFNSFKYDYYRIRLALSNFNFKSKHKPN